MGKKARKTRWRTLSISGPQSDSEEQTHDSGYYGQGDTQQHQHRPSRGDRGTSGPPYYQNGGGTGKYHPQHSSSQSTPTRHTYGRSNSHGGESHAPKSTRSSSTASDNKIIFNEDEYTRITTPRQDVLFKKGYLSKPKPYLQQHHQHQHQSSGSTGGSTGNGTPDHHSADGTESTESVEYEHPPFVYPNGFIDQNGICYLNGVPGFEPFPGFVVYNTGPVCYPPYVPSRVKRYSTDSMTESTSPNTEPQEPYQDGEALTNGHNQDYSNQPMYNFVYPGYVYGNGVYPQPEIVQNDIHSTDPRRLKKKRRRRKISRSKPPNEETTNGYTDEEYSSDDEILSQSEESYDQSDSMKHVSNNHTSQSQLNATNHHTTVKTEALPTLVNGHSHSSHDQPQPSKEKKHTSGTSTNDSQPENSNEVTSSVNETLDQASHSSLSEHSTEDREELKNQSKDSAEGADQSNDTAQTNECLKEHSLAVESSTVLIDQSRQSEDVLSPCDVTEVNLVDKVDESISQLPGEAVPVDLNDSLIANDTSNAVVDSTVDLDNENETNKKLDVSNEDADVNSEDTSKDALQTDVENAQESISKESKPKYRVDAEEFVPRAYRQNYENHVPVTNFIPLPIIGDIYPPNFPSPAFMPPINFIPGLHFDKFVPNFIPNQYFINQEQFYMRNHHITNEEVTENAEEKSEETGEDEVNEEKCDKVVETEAAEENKEKPAEEKKDSKKPVDVAKIVNKLDEAVVEQTKTETSPIKTAKNLKNLKTDRSSPRKYTDKRQNHERMLKKPNATKAVTKEEIEVKAVTKVDSEVKTEKTETNMPENVETTKIEIKITNSDSEAVPKTATKSEPTFSKMLKSSISLIENKTNDFKPVYKKQTSLNGKTAVKDVPNAKNYSDTVKKPFKRNESTHLCPRYERNLKAFESADKKPTKLEENTKKVEVKRPETKPAADSWISVSSRKKRKNKSVIMDEVNDSMIDENKSMNASVEAEPSIEVCVAEIEKTYKMQEEAQQKTINEVAVEKEDRQVEIVQVEESKVELVVEEKIEIPVEPEVNVTPVKIEKKIKKHEKQKGKTNKNKRIIINDKELQTQSNIECAKIITNGEVIKPDQEVNEETKTIEDKQEEVIIVNIKEKTVEEIPQETEVQSNNDALDVTDPEVTIKIEEIDVVPEIKEDKTKEDETKEEIIDEQKTEISKSKKKKRKTKPNKAQSSPSITSADESYDFLIEPNSFADPESKTNVEVSLEIDRMIQRGLYANLEEKLKTFNPSDSFIQSASTDDFNFDISKPFESNSAFKTFDKLKNFDFGGVFFNTTVNKTLEKVMLNKNTSEEKKMEKEVLKKKMSNENLNSDAAANQEADDDEEKAHSSTDSNASNDSVSNHENTDVPVNFTNGQHFPITKAVKEWMNKTRENTPEVELLKSVNEIRSEYLICYDLESENERDEEQEMPKNVKGLPVRATSVSNGRFTNGFQGRTRESHENSPDLLDYWEPDIEIKNYDNNVIDLKRKNCVNDYTVQNGNVPEQNGHVSDGEDVLEAYESVYGKNQDFLRIQKEIEEKTCEIRNLSFPKDGGLPYRAICCNVM